MTAPFTSSAPGRLCLFGEHQDYLGLPVIAVAMNRRCALTFEPLLEMEVKVHSAALGDLAHYSLLGMTAEDRTSAMGHALSAMLDTAEGLPHSGWKVTIASEVPIRAGCSSSTALLTAWIAGWGHILHGGLDTREVVRRCHQYEVLDFNGAGGNMDQFACGHGGLHRFGSGAPQKLHLPDGTFVLADSGAPKDTQGHLRRCRDGRIPLMPHIDAPKPGMTTDEVQLLEGTRINRDLEIKWAALMATEGVDGAAMGADLTRHHAVLRDTLGLSTPRIEAMLDAAGAAGAWGGKINGSGGGGCAFALCPDDRVNEVVNAMTAAGAAGAWPVHMDKGVTCPL